LADLEVRDIPHVERMVRIRIGIACGPRIEVSACGGEIGLTFADGVEVHTMQPRLQPRGGNRDVHHDARTGLAFNELRAPLDAVTLDVGHRACRARFRRGRGSLLRERQRAGHGHDGDPTSRQLQPCILHASS
jgi:hypothetical protein